MSWLFSVTAPVYEDAARPEATVILRFPELPAATVMGFATVRADAIMSVALLLPLESPSVILPVPREAALVAWLTVPDLIVIPPLHPVLFPVMLNVPSPLLMIPPVPETTPVDRVVFPEPPIVRTLPAFVTLPDTVSNVEELFVQL